MLQDLTYLVRSVAWSPDSQQLASAADAPYAYELRIWDAESGKSAATLKVGGGQALWNLALR